MEALDPRRRKRLLLLQRQQQQLQMMILGNGHYFYFTHVTVVALHLRVRRGDNFKDYKIVIVISTNTYGSPMHIIQTWAPFCQRHDNTSIEYCKQRSR
jgi:hypothetical protein